MFDRVVMAVGLSACVSFLVTYITIPFLQRLAHIVGLIDIPDGRIKRHKIATPYLGGIGVYFGFFVGAVASCFFTHSTFNSLFVGLTILLLVGLLDDIISMSPTQKLLGQILAAVCFLYAGVHLKAYFMSSGINWIISFVWILTVVNAINLVDVMDGLATSLSFWAAFGFFCVSLSIGTPLTTLLITSLMGALMAFFCYNKPPAKIYLGDAGALFIGGFLAAIPFSLRWGTYTPYGYLVPVILLAIPLLEVVSLVIIRWRKGIPFYNGSPDHYCHYLQQKGWSIRRVLIFSSSLSLLLVVVSILFVLGLMPLWRVCVYGALFVMIWSLIYKQRSSV